MRKAAKASSVLNLSMNVLKMSPLRAKALFIRGAKTAETEQHSEQERNTMVNDGSISRSGYTQNPRLAEARLLKAFVRTRTFKKRRIKLLKMWWQRESGDLKSRNSVRRERY